MKNNIGILLLHMGGPDKIEDIQDYLTNLFSDPYILQIPFGKYVQPRIAKWIAKKRISEASKRYNLIGGGSPIRKETERLRVYLEASLNTPVRYAFQYIHPFVEEVISSFIQRGITHLVLLPLYPQYSQTTSKSSIISALESLNSDIKIEIIENHHLNSGYIQSMVEQIRLCLPSEEEWNDLYLLFVAHSIPMKYVKRGDPYVQQTKQSMDAIIEQFSKPINHSLAFQSKLGPIAWQGPSLEEALEKIIKKQIKRLVVVPLSFFSENLETLYDLDMEFKQLALSKGITHYVRLQTPANQPLYSQGLVQILKETILLWEDNSV